MPKFEHFVFGEIDAAEEARRFPNLLLDGFCDHRNAASEIEASDAFLLLGVKGAGKSAVLEHLRLKYESRDDINFDYWDLSNFPIADVRNVKTGQQAGLGRTQSSWELLLLLRLVARLKGDGSSSNGSASFGTMWRDLNRAGLVSSDDWKTQVVEWSKATAKLSVPFAGDLGLEFGRQSIPLFQLAEAIKKVLQQTSVVKRHIIALDGLDLLYFESENKRQSISGLIQAVRALNLWSLDPGRIPVSIVCCLRSDMFNTLGSSETSKYSGKSVTLDWARNWRQSDEVWRLLEQKLSVSHPQVDLRRDYFSDPVATRESLRAADVFILEHTRLFPRDVVAAMKFIQRAVRASRKEVLPGKLPGHIVKDGIELYCNEYFESELTSNLAGTLSEENQSYSKTDLFVDFLKNMKARRFTFDDATAGLAPHLSELEVKALLKQSFETSFIGKRDPRSGQVTFAYRRPGGTGFSLDQDFIPHNALVRAWTL